MGLFGIGCNSGQQEQAQRNGERAWEELQETREEVQGALQHEAGHVKEKVDQQARGVKEQLGHLKGKTVRGSRARQGEGGAPGGRRWGTESCELNRTRKGKAEGEAVAPVQKCSWWSWQQVDPAALIPLLSGV